MVVSKLAAILRVADALDNSHSQQVREIRCRIQDDELVLSVSGTADLTVERRALALKGDMFTDVFCMDVHLEED